MNEEKFLQIIYTDKKICIECRQELSINNFRHKNSISYSDICKSCARYIKLRKKLNINKTTIIIQPPTHNMCIKCNLIKPIEDFARTNHSSYGNICKTCNNIQHKQWRLNNPDKQKAIISKYNKTSHAIVVSRRNRKLVRLKNKLIELSTKMETNNNE